MISVLWVILLVAALLFGVLTGRLGEVSAAVATGAAESVTLCISITGIMCLWSGVMEIMSDSGLAERLSKLCAPVIQLVFGKKVAKDTEASRLISSNMTANLLGVSNAATPIGLQAIDRIYSLCGRKGTPNEVLWMIILNTTSIQLIPTTVAAVRVSLGAQNPYDIMPAIWGASILSVIVAVSAGKLFAKISK